MVLLLYYNAATQLKTISFLPKAKLLNTSQNINSFIAKV
jgi:hypothetical protein